MSGCPAINVDSDVRGKCTNKCVIVTPAVDSIKANAPLGSDISVSKINLVSIIVLCVTFFSVSIVFLF